MIPGPCTRCGKTAVEMSVQVRKAEGGKVVTIWEKKVFITTGDQCAMCQPAEYLTALNQPENRRGHPRPSRVPASVNRQQTTHAS